jgi:hypothetical protein
MEKYMPVSKTCEPFLECTNVLALMTVSADGVTGACDSECKHGDYASPCPAQDTTAELAAFNDQISELNTVGVTVNVGDCLQPHEYALWDQELQNYKCHTQIMDYINACDQSAGTFSVTNYFDGATATTLECEYCHAGGMRLVDQYLNRGPACVTDIATFTTGLVSAFRNNAICEAAHDTTWYGCVTEATASACTGTQIPYYFGCIELNNCNRIHHNNGVQICLCADRSMHVPFGSSDCTYIYAADATAAAAAAGARRLAAGDVFYDMIGEKRTECDATASGIDVTGCTICDSTTCHECQAESYLSASNVCTPIKHANDICNLGTASDAIIIRRIMKEITETGASYEHYECIDACPADTTSGLSTVADYINMLQDHGHATDTMSF